MDDPRDYSKTVFDQGIVCFNTNNKNHCIVIDGRQGDDQDRCSLVIEFCGSRGYMLHTPPNRALIPTGKTVNLLYLARTLKRNVVMVREENEIETPVRFADEDHIWVLGKQYVSIKVLGERIKEAENAERS